MSDDDQLPSTERRCTRCGIPGPGHSDTSKNGGVSLNSDGVCLVCYDYRQEYGFYPDTTQKALTDA